MNRVWGEREVKMEIATYIDKMWGWGESERKGFMFKQSSCNCKIIDSMRFVMDKCSMFHACFGYNGKDKKVESA